MTEEPMVEEPMVDEPMVTEPMIEEPQAEQAPNVRSLDDVAERGVGERGVERPDPDVDRHVHIVLFGLMGAGKSTVGRIVANELGRPFVDSDSIVELRSGDLPPDLADHQGADALHQHELAAFRQVVAQRDSVVFAAAASVVDTVTPAELEAVWPVWLATTPDVLAARIDADAHDRPLLGGGAGPALERQHDRRADRGREMAELVVDTDDRTPTEVAAAICAAWREWADGSR